MALIAACLLTLLAGCANMPYLGQTNSAAQQTGAAAPGGEKSNVVYYDFDDIAVPADFKLINESSLVLTGPVKSGVLVFDGRVKAVSTAEWMATMMGRDNWRMKGCSKYGRTLMVFEKPGKMAVITISDGNIYTRLEVWVLPLPEAPATQPSVFPLAN
jgi:hypothetical protein